MPPNPQQSTANKVPGDVTGMFLLLPLAGAVASLHGGGQHFPGAADLSAHPRNLGIIPGSSRNQQVPKQGTGSGGATAGGGNGRLSFEPRVRSDGAAKAPYSGVLPLKPSPCRELRLLRRCALGPGPSLARSKPFPGARGKLGRLDGRWTPSECEASAHISLRCLIAVWRGLRPSLHFRCQELTFGPLMATRVWKPGRVNARSLRTGATSAVQGAGISISSVLWRLRPDAQ